MGRLLNRLRNLVFGEYIGDLQEEIASLHLEVEQLREYVSSSNLEAMRLETQLRNRIAELEAPKSHSVQLELLQRALAQAQGESRNLKALLAKAQNENQSKSFGLQPSPVNWFGADVRSIRDVRISGPNRTEGVPSAAILPVTDDAYESRISGACSGSEPEVACAAGSGNDSTRTAGSDFSSE